MRWQTILILVITLAGFALRLSYLTTTHPFFDEYTTVLAARQILNQGWPILPSGLFYEHGLLSTYLIAPFTALFIHTPTDQWQPAHWGLMLSRWPSLLISTATIPLIYAVGSRFNSQWSMVNGQWSTIHPPSSTLHPSSSTLHPPSSTLHPPPSTLHPPSSTLHPPSSILHPPSSTFHLPSSISLLAAGLFAFSPEGMVWGGRARMYALATLLVLLTAAWAYRGAVYPAPARYRWWAVLALLAVLLTQFGAIMLVPPLVIAMLVVGWLSYKTTRQQNIEEAEKHNNQISRPTPYALRPWFLRPSIIWEALALASVVGLGIWVKRLGQPLGAAALGSAESGSLSSELLDTITYQTAFHFTWPDTLDFLAEQFGPPHLFWLALAAIIAAIGGLAILLINNWRMSQWQTANNVRQSNNRRFTALSADHVTFSPSLAFNLFLWLTFGLIIIEMVTLLDPFRRNPRYLVMYLPLFYLIAAYIVLRGAYYVPRGGFALLRIVPPMVVAVLGLIGWNDVRIALITPEPAYEEAFAYVQQNWQPGDTLLTMNTPAAGLYLGHADGFTVQEDAEQFLLNRQTAPVDRWLGAPWLGTSARLNETLNSHERVWFVIDTIRQPVYFRGDWQAVVNSQMEQVWSKDNALIYRSRPDRIPLPGQPDKLVNATLGGAIELVGYSLQLPPTQSLNLNTNERILNLQSPISNLRLTLFWRALHPLTTDYTVFLHLRSHEGAVVAQHDGLPLNGAYLTSRWQPDELVIDPFNLSLPADLLPGRYTLWAGLYRLDTLERLPVAADTSGENAILLGEINYQ